MLVAQMAVDPHRQRAATTTARLTRRDSQRRRSLACALWSLEGSLVRVAAFVSRRVPELPPVWRASTPPPVDQDRYKRF
jgi:hypothetical protein